jgi:hypothetical protein
MILPDEAFSSNLTATEFRALVAICHLMPSDGVLRVSHKELGILTQCHRNTLSRAVQGLERAGLLSVEQSRRNYGKLSTNVYKLTAPSFINGARLITQPSTINGAPTYDYSSSNSSNSNKNYSNSNESITSQSEVVFKEVIVSSSKRWVPQGDDTSGDDSIGGVGLFDDEKPAVKSKLSTDKRDPKTRGRRPEHEWTPADVAAEFSFRIGRKFPLLPGLVHVGKLGGALARNRKQYGVTAAVELELMKMFFDDTRNFHQAESQPHYLYRKFLRTFTTHMDEALRNLGLPPRHTVDMPDTVSAMVEEYLFASDGRKFDNSMPGRAALERYEIKLRGKK